MIYYFNTLCNDIVKILGGTTKLLNDLLFVLIATKIIAVLREVSVSMLTYLVIVLHARRPAQTPL